MYRGPEARDSRHCRETTRRGAGREARASQNRSKGEEAPCRKKEEEGLEKNKDNAAVQSARPGLRRNLLPCRPVCNQRRLYRFGHHRTVRPAHRRASLQVHLLPGKLIHLLSLTGIQFMGNAGGSRSALTQTVSS